MSEAISAAPPQFGGTRSRRAKRRSIPAGRPSNMPGAVVPHRRSPVEPSKVRKAVRIAPCPRPRRPRRSRSVSLPSWSSTHQLVELVRQAVDGELELLLEAELERNFLHG